MRVIILVAAAFAVGGCMSSPDQQIHPGPQALTGCAAVAQDRVNDAAANGYDAVMQEAVYKEAYNSCAGLQVGRKPPAK